jgi:hypothetical protein
MGNMFDRPSYDNIGEENQENIELNNLETYIRNIKDDENIIPAYSEMCKDTEFSALLVNVSLCKKIIEVEWPLYNGYAIIAKIFGFNIPYGTIITSGKEYGISELKVYLLTLEDIDSLLGLDFNIYSNRTPLYHYLQNPDCILINIPLFQPMIDMCDIIKNNTTKTYKELKQEIQPFLRNFDPDDTYAKITRLSEVKESLKTHKLL